jgi:hypothetical protein
MIWVRVRTVTVETDCSRRRLYMCRPALRRSTPTAGDYRHYLGTILPQRIGHIVVVASSFFTDMTNLRVLLIREVDQNLHHQFTVLRFPPSATHWRIVDGLSTSASPWQHATSSSTFHLVPRSTPYTSACALVFLPRRLPPRGRK